MSIDDTNGHRATPEAACGAEGRTLAWIEGRLSPDDAAAAERHVAECRTCRETIAMISEFEPGTLQPDDEALLDAVSERTAVAAIELGRRMSQPENGETAGVEPPAEQRDEPGRTAGRRRPAWWLAAAAVLAVAVPAWLWLARDRGPATLDRGEALLAQATGDARPSELRVSGQVFAPVRVTRGVGGPDSERLEAARAVFAAAVEASPSPAARHALGRALLATGDAAGAVAELERARDAAPSDAGILSDLAVARAQSGDPAGALTDLDRALVLDPDRTEALFNRAVLRAREGDSTGAAADVDRLRQRDAASPWTAEAVRLVGRADAGPR